ncbi:MAG: hypothetical protein ISR51_00495 [Rhodospirillales bacterium]|nr:hypothetical protein [Alphaproteobacteria bacterium]MBL6947129.1 hypothetical protein [Rhodospirillales bacterium]
MTDGVGNTTSQTAPLAQRPSGYQSESIREVRARAQTIPQKTSNEERDGLTRLNRILGQDQPLRDNAPRGFYLNITI